MSKVFFFNIPFHGHMNPSLGLVKELVNRGEEVIYYCTDSFKEKIESAGATFRSYGKKFYLNENFVTYNITELYRIHMDLSELILDDLLNDIKTEKPDYIIHDSLCTWAKHAAEVSNVPAVNTITTLVMVPDGIMLTVNFLISLSLAVLTNIPNMKKIYKISRSLKRKYNINANSLIDIVVNKEKMNLVYTSKEYQPQSEKLENGYRFVGPLSVYRNEDSSKLVLNRSGNKPLLFISMGTIFNNNKEFFYKCVEAFGDMDLDILMSVGKNVDISSLTIPDNFTVKHYYEIPQLDVLKKCSVFITHGGMNSTHEGLFNGIPLVVIPQQEEQAYVAKQVVRSGCGICLNRSNATSKMLRDSVEKIISDKSFKENALKMRDSFISAGGAKRAVEEIFSYTRKKCVTNQTTH
ncbi:MAG TPA: macrolide family glycosyltransferase [Clostridia bacterium]